jgi:hypothetical protein
MATRAAQKTEILTPAQALAFIKRHGVVCESASRGAIPSLAQAIAGETLRGNWWSHAKSREIFAITRAVRDAPEILVCKIVDNKVTFVHKRVWPALVRMADRFPRARLARVREVHSATGKHVLETTPFPNWVPQASLAAAKRISEARAAKEMKALLELAKT